MISTLNYCFWPTERHTADLVRPTCAVKMVSGLINANPVVYEKKERRPRSGPVDVDDEYAVESIDQLEIFDILFVWFYLC